MSERDRHSKRRFRDEVPDPDDRYDPKQGAKRSKRDDEGLEPGLTPRQQRELPDFSDRYEPHAGRPDNNTRSRSKERPPHSSREHREHTSSREHKERDSSRSHRSSRHHSPERASGDRPADRQRHSDSRDPQVRETSPPRQPADQKGDASDNRPSFEAPGFGGRGPGMSDRGGFGRGTFMPGRGRGRGSFDNFQGRGSGGADWNEGQDSMPSDGGRGSRGGFVPRGRFGRFGGRFEGGGGRMEGRFDSFRGRGGFPFRGRGGRGFGSAEGVPMPFSRGQEGPMDGGPGRGFAPGRGGFVAGGRGAPPTFQRRPPNVDPAVAERRKESSEKRLRQQVSQLHIAADLIPERLNDKHQLLLKTDSQDKGANLVVPVQTASAYFYTALHIDHPVVATPLTGGVDRAGFDAAVELYQWPQVAQWTRTSSHGTFALTSTQVMASV